jgi:uncharacterized protein (TIGR03435 family)
LIERFHLKYHLETAQGQGFTLTVDKSGPKLKSSEAAETSFSFNGPNGPQIKPVPGQLISMNARKVSIPALTALLSQVLGGPVVDKTELTGDYDFTLAWDEVKGPVLSTAMREQLGLTMTGTKVPVSTFVVDAAEKPSAN